MSPVRVNARAKVPGGRIANYALHKDDWLDSQFSAVSNPISQSAIQLLAVLGGWSVEELIASRLSCSSQDMSRFDGYDDNGKAKFKPSYQWRQCIRHVDVPDVSVNNHLRGWVTIGFREGHPANANVDNGIITFELDPFLDDDEGPLARPLGESLAAEIDALVPEIGEVLSRMASELLEVQGVRLKTRGTVWSNETNEESMTFRLTFLIVEQW